MEKDKLRKIKSDIDEFIVKNLQSEFKHSSKVKIEEEVDEILKYRVNIYPFSDEFFDFFFQITLLEWEDGNVCISISTILNEVENQGFEEDLDLEQNITSQIKSFYDEFSEFLFN